MHDYVYTIRIALLLHLLSASPLSKLLISLLERKSFIPLSLETLEKTPGTVAELEL